MKNSFRLLSHICRKVSSNRNILFGALVLCLLSGSCTQDGSTITVQVDPTEVTAHNIPVNIEITLPPQFQNTEVDQIGVTLGTQDRSVLNIPGQVTKEGDGQYRLWWIMPTTNANEATEWKVSFHEISDSQLPVFEWRDEQGKHMDLVFDNKKVFRYEYELDSQFLTGETLTAKNRVFYHIYDLAGQRLITNGYEPGIWSHHRGIMIGWRDVMYKGRKFSFWGMEQLTTQKHMKFLELIAGPVLARVKSLIHWNDSTGHTIIEEIRTATIYHQPPPGIAIVDFASHLTAVDGTVSLDGDPEHAGVQYRAHNDVAADSAGSQKPTYYFHQDGIDPKKDYNLPWVGMSYDLDNKTYSVIEMNGTGNPEPAIWSAYRDYGRFGPYVRKSLLDGESFDLHYRFVISESSMPSREEIDAQYLLYHDPPTANIN